MENSRKCIDPVADSLLFRLEPLKPGQLACVALSGGMDSVVLLHGLVRLREQRTLSLSALHVNHQLQPDAPQWGEFCQELCRQWEVPLVLETVSVARQPGQSLEAEARHARYAIFRNQAVDWVLLAHHLDDQAETLLLQLLRGAGIQGLQGMPVCRTLGDGPGLLRPLLSVPRREMLRYAQRHGLRWVDDPSNQDVRYTRNFLRQRVTPRLEEIAPAWRTTMARSAAHLATAQRLLDELAQQDYQNCQCGDGLEGRGLQRLSMDRGVNLLRWWVRRAGAPSCSARRWEDWWRQCGAGPDRHPQLCWRGWRVFRQQGVWYVRPLSLAACRESAADK